MDKVLKVTNLSKQYRLGVIGTGTISHDLNRWWHQMRGKEDPYLKIGEENVRSSGGGSQYVWALRDIDFELERGEAFGIIGKNGAGKSTLLKILSRVTTPTTGKVLAKGKIASLLEVGTGFHPELTGRENIFLNGAILGMKRNEIQKKFDEILDFSGVERYVDTPVKRYSSGMYVRLAFAVAAYLEPDILVVDEVLAVGDMEFQKKCIGKMKDVASGGRTVLFVSHNLNMIRSLCAKTLLLENGGLRMIGETKEVVELYQSGVKETASASSTQPGRWRNLHFKEQTGVDIELAEMMDPNTDQIKPDVAYGESVKFRIHYHTSVGNPNAIFGLTIKNFEGTVLIDFTTYYDLVSTPIEANTRGYVDCIFNQWPLTAGEYILDVRISDRQVGRLCNLENFGVLDVIPNDAIPGRDPYTSLMSQVYVEHSWKHEILESS